MKRRGLNGSPAGRATARLAPDTVSLCHNVRQVFDLLAEIVKRLDEVIVVLLRLLGGDLDVLRDLPDQTLRFTLAF
jgi:hypothetical protein